MITIREEKIISSPELPIQPSDPTVDELTAGIQMYKLQTFTLNDMMIQFEDLY